MDFGDFKGIGSLIALLFLLAARRRKKQAETREQDDRDYEPIEPEALGTGMTVSKAVSTVFRVYTIIISVAFVAALVYTVVFEQTTNWFILGAVAVVLLIYLVRESRQSDVTIEINPDDPWEE